MNSDPCSCVKCGLYHYLPFFLILTLSLNSSPVLALCTLTEFHLPSFECWHPLARTWLALMLWQITGSNPAQLRDLSRIICHVSHSYSLLSLTLSCQTRNMAVPFYIHLFGLEKSSYPHGQLVFIFDSCVYFKPPQSLGYKFFLYAVFARSLTVFVTDH